MKRVVLFKGESEDYLKAFSDKHFDVIFIDPLQFTFVNAEELNKKLCSKYDGLILTSPRAAQALSKCWDPSKFAIWNSRKTYTVGETSREKIALLLGLEAVGAASGNSENLAKVIINENLKTSNFLFPCGNLKSEILPNLFESADLGLDALTVYETQENECLRKELIELNNSESDLTAVVFFSPSGCEFVYRQLQTLKNKLLNVPHFAIGNLTAHKIVNFGLDVAGVAKKPNADSIVESVQNYFDNL